MQENINFPKELTENFLYDFKIDDEGLYLIEIIANAKSWWQNLKKFRAFFDDDDLAVKIDGIEFPKLDGKRGLFDGEAAWNGNNLKGLKKTAVFILNLDKGLHKIEFVADQKPIIHSIGINKLDEAQIEYIPMQNKQAEDGNGRQWITIAISDLPLQNLEISARAEKREKDCKDWIKRLFIPLIILVVLVGLQLFQLKAKHNAVSAEAPLYQNNCNYSAALNFS